MASDLQKLGWAILGSNQLGGGCLLSVIRALTCIFV